ncbi:hypothetical protein ACHAXS_007501 [Conticribra weissflogii]
MPISHNSYFNSQVQSLATERNGRKFSVGIISSGNIHYFGTSAAERMTVVSGMLLVKLDATKTDDDGESGSSDAADANADAQIENKWVHIPAGSSFEVPENSGFHVKAQGDSAYLCEYL